MNSPTKQQLDLIGVGELCSEQYLAPELVVRLRVLLPGSAQPGQAAMFIAFCDRTAYVLKTMSLDQAPAAIRSEVEKVAAAAHRLLNAIRTLCRSSAMSINGYRDLCVLSKEPPRKLHHARDERLKGDAFLAVMAELLADLQSVAELSAQHVQTSAHVKLTEQRARWLTAELATAWHQLTNCWPPYSKNTWFPKFMFLLGDGVDDKLSIGQTLVQGVVCALTRSPDHIE